MKTRFKASLGLVLSPLFLCVNDAPPVLAQVVAPNVTNLFSPPVASFLTTAPSLSVRDGKCALEEAAKDQCLEELDDLADDCRACMDSAIAKGIGGCNITDVAICEAIEECRCRKCRGKYKSLLRCSTGCNISCSTLPVVPSSVPSDVPSDAPSDVPSDTPSDVPSDTPSFVPTVYIPKTFPPVPPACQSEKFNLATCYESFQLPNYGADCDICIAQVLPRDPDTSCTALNDILCPALEGVCPCPPCGNEMRVLLNCIRLGANDQCLIDCTGTRSPTRSPTNRPTSEPTAQPTGEPTEEPTTEPTAEPTQEPSDEPTEEPSEEPTPEPSKKPTRRPATRRPTKRPTKKPSTRKPTKQPTRKPITRRPTRRPMTRRPTSKPATKRPTQTPATRRPTNKPATMSPTRTPTRSPTNVPSTVPSQYPTYNAFKNCTSQDTALEQCLTNQLGSDAPACSQCVTASIPVPTPNCITLANNTCDAIAQCPCAPCDDVLEKYYDCLFFLEDGCRVFCSNF